jgi:hypothetical protein
MIHGQLGKWRRVKGATSFACAGLFSFLIGDLSRPANAGEFDRSMLPPTVAGPARCDSGGVFKDSGHCKRISGYVAAGSRFEANEIGGRSSAFGPLDPPEFVGAIRAAGAALIAMPAAGLDRIFLPPSAADESH